jgi:hypothetical protein
MYKNAGCNYEEKPLDQQLILVRMKIEKGARIKIRPDFLIQISYEKPL